MPIPQSPGYSPEAHVPKAAAQKATVVLPDEDTDWPQPIALVQSDGERHVLRTEIATARDAKTGAAKPNAVSRVRVMFAPVNGSGAERMSAKNRFGVYGATEVPTTVIREILAKPTEAQALVDFAEAHS